MIEDIARSATILANTYLRKQELLKLKGLWKIRNFLVWNLDWEGMRCDRLESWLYGLITE